MNKKSPYHFFDDLLIRVPVLNEEVLENCDAEESIIEKYDSIKEAVFLSSSALYNRVKEYSKLNTKKQERIIDSIHKFLIRASTRPTPFSLFAGVFVGQWGDQSESQIEQCFRFHLSLDYELIYSIINIVREKYGYFTKILYYKNPSIHIKNGNFQVFNPSSLDSGLRDYQISEYELDHNITVLFDYLSENGYTITELISFFLDRGENLSEVTGFLESLIASSVLIPEYELNLSNKLSFESVCNLLCKVLPETEETEILKEIKNRISKINSHSQISISSLNNLKRLINELVPNYDSNNFFKVDMIGLSKPPSVRLSNSYQDSIIDAIDFFEILDLRIKNPKIDYYKKKILQRYKYASIPILELLDPNKGIVYDNEVEQDEGSLISSIPFFKENEFKGSSADQLFLREKLNEALLENKQEIIITKEELSHFSRDSRRFHKSLSVLFRPVDAKLIYPDVLSSNAAKIIGRFRYGDKDVSSLVQKIIQHEKNISSKNRIYAEIAHIPAKLKACNLIDNVDLRSHKIPVFYSPEKISSENIYLTDLYVTIRENKIVLFSKSLNKEVVPCMTSMIISSTVSRLPIYNFLNDLARYNETNYMFSWNNVTDTKFLKYFPRVRYKNVLISPEIWILDENDLNNLQNYEKSENIVTSYRMKRKLPLKVIIKDGDNELLVNFDNKISVRQLVKLLRTKKRLVLREYLYSDNAPIQTFDKKSLNTELVAFLYRKKDDKEIKKGQMTKFYTTSDIEVQRNFALGSKWIYYKLYCTPKQADKFIIESLPVILKKLNEFSLIDQWFYIRYIDSDHHLRIRFLSKKLANIYDIVKIVNNHLAKIDTVYKYLQDSYEREIERYTAKTILLSESIFYNDSQFSLDLLTYKNSLADSKDLWVFFLKSIDSFLDLFKLKIEDKIILFEDLRQDFYKEFFVNKIISSSINDKYRLYKDQITDMLFSQDYSFEEYKNLTISLLKRNQNIKDDVKDILLLNSKSELDLILKSHIHMFVNRFITEDPRKHEVVIYSLLEKVYKSRKYITNHLHAI